MTETETALKPLDDRMTKILVDHHRRFRSFIAKRVGSENVAEDLLQASLKKALEAPAQSVEESSIVAWFYRILKNTLTDYYRAQAAEDRKKNEYIKTLDQTGHQHTRAADDIEAAVCECMEGLLPTLKDDYAAIIQNIDLQGKPVAHVARDLGITENNLNVRLYRARKALKLSLERACGTCTEHGCLNCTCE